MAEPKDLFDVIEIEAARLDPASCRHVREEKTETNWLGYGVRMTWTCAACGRVRGRC